MLTAGTYQVKKLKDCFMGMSKEKGTPYFCITFILENGENANWMVYLSSEFKSDEHRKAAENNMKTLALLGYKGSRVSDMAEGSIDELFDEIEDPISLVIELETYEGKERPKVKFVNVGSGGFVKIDKKAAVVATKSMAYDGFLSKSKKENPVKIKPKSEPVSDEVPF